MLYPGDLVEQLAKFDDARGPVHEEHATERNSRKIQRRQGVEATGQLQNPMLRSRTISPGVLS
jgi:hypothetical protein